MCLKKSFLIIPFLLFVSAYIVYAWTKPSQSSLSGNVVLPLNTSSQAQTKQGNLNILGRVAIGHENPSVPLEVNGEIRADILRDRNNLGFYLNPYGTSYLRYVNADIFYDRNNNSFLVDPDGTSFLRYVIIEKVYDFNNVSYYVEPASTSCLKRIIIDNKWNLGTTLYTNDAWLRIFDVNGNDYYGGIAAGRIWTRYLYVFPQATSWPYPGTSGPEGGEIRMSCGSGYSSPWYFDVYNRTVRWHRNGDVEMKLTYDGNLYIDKSYHCNGADVAEITPASYSYELEPGDVVCLDENNEGKLRKCLSAYEKTIAGVYSSDPGLVLNSGEAANTEEEQEQIQIDGIPLALAGRVKTKATTENGPINVGDLLVSSSKPGYAMRANEDIIKDKPGVVLGKAMESLEQGEGKIMVLISLR